MTVDWLVLPKIIKDFKDENLYGVNLTLLQLCLELHKRVEILEQQSITDVSRE